MEDITEVIEQELNHAPVVEQAFLQALCIFETHYQKRPSSLLEMFPDLEGHSIDEEQAQRLQQILVRFIQELPAHASITSAIWLLSMSGDPSYRDFYITQLRRYLAWRNSVVVSLLLSALERMGERVFYDADGKHIGSRSSEDAETNFGIASRYLKKHDNPT